MSKRIKVKFDQYLIRGKHGKMYRVLVGPECKYLAADYDDWHGEYVIDAAPDEMKFVKYAFAILCNDPGVIIYFKRGSAFKTFDTTGWYIKTNDVVLCRKEVQLNRSNWYDIKKHIDRPHKIENYTFYYDRDKLQDWYEKRYENDCIDEFDHRVERGDTTFFSFDRKAAYKYFDEITRAMSKFKEHQYSVTEAYRIANIVPYQLIDYRINGINTKLPNVWVEFYTKE